MKKKLAGLIFAACCVALGASDCTSVGGSSLVRAQEAKNEVSRITASEPAAIISGTKSSLKLRGFKLKESNELRFPAALEVKGEITEKKDSSPPKGLENKLVGDTQLLAEVTVPANHPAGILEYVVSTAAGDIVGKIKVLAVDSSMDETEPNNGFHEAQKMLPQTFVRGSIQSDKDVDVYAFPAIAGQKLKVTVTSGSTLIMDAALHCYDARGQFLAAADDGESRDPVMMLKSTVDGVLYLCISSAHDIGGEWSSYLLSVKEIK